MTSIVQNKASSSNTDKEEMMLVRRQLRDSVEADLKSMDTGPDKLATKIRCSQLKHACSARLIYTCWTSVPNTGSSSISGSLLHELYPQSIEEADEMVRQLEKSRIASSATGANYTYRYIHIHNEPHYWDRVC